MIDNALRPFLFVFSCQSIVHMFGITYIVIIIAKRYAAILHICRMRGKNAAFSPKSQGEFVEIVLNVT